MNIKNIIDSLSVLTDSVKNTFDYNRDKRLDNIKDAMSLLGYKYKEEAEDCITCELAANRELRYKSKFLLRLSDNQTIYLGYTIYGKRCIHNSLLQKTESKELLKGYHYQSALEYLLIHTTLSGDGIKKKGISNTIKKIQETALAVYTDAGIPEDPEDAMDINGIKVKSIKNMLASIDVFDDISVSETLVRGEKREFTNDKQQLWSYGISITPSDLHSIKVTAYLHTIALPIEQSKKIGNKFFSEFKIEGTSKCTPTELSYAVTFGVEKGEKALKDLIVYMLRPITHIYVEVDTAAFNEYKRIAMELIKKRELEQQERKRQERAKGLNYAYTIRLTPNITIKDIQDLFSKDYPNLRLEFSILF